MLTSCIVYARKRKAYSTISQHVRNISNNEFDLRLLTRDFIANGSAVYKAAVTNCASGFNVIYTEFRPHSSSAGVPLVLTSNSGYFSNHE
jgi:hypothetical protein